MAIRLAILPVTVTKVGNINYRSPKYFKGRFVSGDPKQTVKHKARAVEITYTRFYRGE